jgi:CpXC protein
MSQIKLQVVTCPECGFAEERTLFASLNGERVPAQVPHLLDDTFEEQACAQCGLCFRPEHELLYSHFPLRIWIVMLPRQLRKGYAALETALLAQFAAPFAEAPPLVSAGLAGVRPRLVFGQPFLSEAVRAVELGLDPALLECAKLFFFRRNLPRLMPLGPHELTFRGYLPDGGGALQLAARRLDDGLILDELTMPSGLLDEVSSERAELSARYPELFDRPYISATRYLFGAA